MTKKGVTITIYYPGSVISCNHYLGRRKGGGEYVKTEARAWMDALGWMIKPYHIEDWNMPIHVTCNGKFRDERSRPDLANIGKICLDAIEDVTHINDKHYRWHDGSVVLKKDELPELQITIEEGE